MRLSSLLALLLALLVGCPNSPFIRDDDDVAADDDDGADDDDSTGDDDDPADPGPGGCASCDGCAAGGSTPTSLAWLLAGALAVMRRRVR